MSVIRPGHMDKLLTSPVNPQKYFKTKQERKCWNDNTIVPVIGLWVGQCWPVCKQPSPGPLLQSAEAGTESTSCRGSGLNNVLGWSPGQQGNPLITLLGS